MKKQFCALLITYCVAITTRADVTRSGLSRALADSLYCSLNGTCTIQTLTVTGTCTGCGASGVAWGAITGTLSSQIDLQNALNLKANLISPSLTTPNLGTPTAGVMTNVTGTAAGLTAGFASASDHSIASCGANTWANGSSAAWVLNCVQPAFSNISGSFTLAQFPSLAANTALVNATAGSAVPTAFAMPSCSAADSALKWTTSTGFGCNSSITAATNANLTGPITSSGNVTAVAAQTGTGSTFAMSAGPTFTGTTTTDLFRATNNTPGVHLADFTQQNASGYGVDIIPGADTGVFALQIVNAANIATRDAFFGNGDVQLAQGGGTVSIGGAATVGGTLGITGHVTAEGVTSTGATGTGKFVFDLSPSFTTSAISPLWRSTVAKVLLQGTGTGATQLATTQTTAPTCSSNCGNSPSIAGTDSAGIVTMGGTGSPTSGWVVTFNGTWASAPACVVQSALAGMVVGKMPIVVATTTTTITVTTNGTAPATSDKYQFICVGTQ